jgi:hypothetical protein
MKAEGKQFKMFWERKEARVFAASLHRKGYRTKLCLQHTFGIDLYWVWYWKKGE